MSISHFPGKGEPVERLLWSLYQRRMLRRPLKNTMNIWGPDTLKVCLLKVENQIYVYISVLTMFVDSVDC